MKLLLVLYFFNLNSASDTMGGRMVTYSSTPRGIDFTFKKDITSETYIFERFISQ